MAAALQLPPTTQQIMIGEPSTVIRWYIYSNQFHTCTFKTDLFSFDLSVQTCYQVINTDVKGTEGKYKEQREQRQTLQYLVLTIHHVSQNVSAQFPQPSLAATARRADILQNLLSCVRQYAQETKYNKFTGIIVYRVNGELINKVEETDQSYESIILKQLKTEQIYYDPVAKSIEISLL